MGGGTQSCQRGEQPISDPGLACKRTYPRSSSKDLETKPPENLPVRHARFDHVVWHSPAPEALAAKGIHAEAPLTNVP